jgi:hypothetical protein
MAAAPSPSSTEWTPNPKQQRGIAGQPKEHMMFRGPESKRAQKQSLWEVYALVPGVPKLLDWSDHTISFGLTDHPEYIPNPGKNALVVDPIIGGYQLSKVYMDGGYDLNIIYANTR